MPHAEAGGKVGAFGDREGAAGGDDAVAADDHGPVVQGGVLEENVHDQAPADFGVHRVAGGDDVLEGVLVLDDDERAGACRGHLLAGFGDLLHGAGVHAAGLPAEKDFLEETLLLERRAGLAAHRAEEAAHLGLEDDHEGDRAHVDDGAQQGGDHFHPDRLRDHADDEHEDDGDEDIDGRGPADPPEH